MEFEGLKRDDDGAYYYDDNELEKHTVPLSDNVEGDFPLDHDKLEEYFNLNEDALPKLPRFLVSPDLNSAWGGTYEDNPDQGWYAIHGKVVVYKPIEWVASVSRVRDHPAGEPLAEGIGHEEVEGPLLTVYGPAEIALEIPDLDECLRARNRIKEEVVLAHDLGGLERHVVDDTVEDDVVREEGAFELVLGIMLRVEEVYSHTIPQLTLDERQLPESMTWSDGPGWDDIHIPNDQLARVGGVTFSDIKMIGEGHSDSLWLAALPVFENDGEDVVDLHIALSCAGWADWYAYVVGDKGSSGGERLTAYPQYAPKLAAVPEDH